MRARWLLACWLLALLGWPGATGLAQEPRVDFLDSYVEYQFGKQVDFHATLASPTSVASARIFFHSAGDPHTSTGSLRLTHQQAGQYALAYTHSLAEYALRAFARVEYRFELTLASGQVVNSPAYEFIYSDNRLDWQTLSEAPFRLHWVEGDVAFAQSVLDAAQEGLLRAQAFLPLTVPDEVEIYAYPNASTLQETLTASHAAWVAGHADPDLNVIVVALPVGPEQGLLTRQRLPHELMHILLYHYSPAGYANLPAWLNEGLASIVELYPNPDYRLLMEDSARQKTLLPMTSLCRTFPRDAVNAVLSYAQSASFVNFLYSQYGSTGLQTLVQAYADGMDCPRGVEFAFGVRLDQLDRRWRTEVLAQNQPLQGLGQLLPWWVVTLAVFLAPFSLLILRRQPRKKAQPAASTPDPQGDVK